MFFFSWGWVGFRLGSLFFFLMWVGVAWVGIVWECVRIVFGEVKDIVIWFG